MDYFVNHGRVAAVVVYHRRVRIGEVAGYHRHVVGDEGFRAYDCDGVKNCVEARLRGTFAYTLGPAEALDSFCGEKAVCICGSPRPDHLAGPCSSTAFCCLRKDCAAVQDGCGSCPRVRSIDPRRLASCPIFPLA